MSLQTGQTSRVARRRRIGLLSSANATRVEGSNSSQNLEASLKVAPLGVNRRRLTRLRRMCGWHAPRFSAPGNHPFHGMRCFGYDIPSSTQFLGRPIHSPRRVRQERLGDPRKVYESISSECVPERFDIAAFSGDQSFPSLTMKSPLRDFNGNSKLQFFRTRLRCKRFLSRSCSHLFKLQQLCFREG